MPFVTILHLSDLQCGSSDSWLAPRLEDNGVQYRGTECCVKLVDKLKRVLRPSGGSVDLVLVTGDVAEQGKEEEFDEAYKFLKELSERLAQAGTSPNVFIVPGNHDIDWTACKNAINKPGADHFAAKFSNYNNFCKKFDPGQLVSDERPFISHTLGPKNRPHFIIIGLNSCMKESDQRSDHYGLVGVDQLDKIHEELHKLNHHPFAFTVAAFHHNPLLLPDFYEPLHRELLCHESNAVSLKAAALRNYLHKSKEVLERLVKMGFVLGLHGHQHFDGVLHINFPGKEGEPFVRASIALLGAGSFGLFVGSRAQQGQPSARLLTIEEIPWGWRILTRDIVIKDTGKNCDPSKIEPDVAEEKDEKSFVIPRGQPLEPIVALAKSFELAKELVPGGIETKKLEPDEMRHADQDFADHCEKYMLWDADPTMQPNYREIQEADSGKLWNELKLRLSTVFNDDQISKMETDLRSIYLHGICRWTSGKGVYGNDLLLTLRGLELATGKITFTVCRERFAQHRIFNWMLPSRLLDGGKLSFRRKWLLPLFSRWDGKDFINNLYFFGGRNEANIFLTVRCEDGLELITGTRSKTLDIEGGLVAPFSCGGIRAPNSSTSIDVHTMQNAALEEMQRETGLKLPVEWEKSFHLAAVYLDPLYFTPVWLYWLDITEEQYKELQTSGGKGRDLWEYLQTKARTQLNTPNGYEGLRDSIPHYWNIGGDLTFGLRVLSRSCVWKKLSCS